MLENDKRAKESRERIRCLLLLWTLEAGVIARTTLRERALAEHDFRWETLSAREKSAFNNHLCRDLNGMVTSGLLEALQLQPDGRVGPHIEGRMRNQVYYRAVLQPEFVVFSPEGPSLDPHVARVAEQLAAQSAPRASRGRAELRFALAELKAASGHGGLAAQLLSRVSAALEARFGPSRYTPRIRHRPLPPTLGEASRSAVRAHVWEGVVRALDQGLRIEIRYNRRKTKEPQRLCPYRVVWYNGRPRLEAYWFHRGVRRWCAIPLHHLAQLEALESDRAEWAGPAPSAEERELLDNVWGTDLEDPALLKRAEDDVRPLADLTTEVELLFHGAAASAVRNDPGCALARLSAEHDARGLLIRYRVRTLVGSHFKKWLASWGAEVRVVQPRALAAEVAETARQVYEAHRAALEDEP
ncbi:MAG: WYL domain-containing protein [Candidatus Sericytochromatia bacterium]|nr:WYL domain-containing protein [Candidatus Sericytochromatia bacterium]